jgi:hypothetical protein
VKAEITRELEKQILSQRIRWTIADEIRDWEQAMEEFIATQTTKGKEE